MSNGVPPSFQTEEEKSILEQWDELAKTLTGYVARVEVPEPRIREALMLVVSHLRMGRDRLELAFFILKLVKGELPQLPKEPWE